MSQETNNKNFTMIENDVIEHIMKSKFNGTQCSIILAVLRFTAGFHRESHAMSISFLAEATLKDRKQVDRELTALINRKVLLVAAIGLRGSRVLQINDNFSDWHDIPLNSGQSAKTRTVLTAKQQTVLTANSLDKKESIKENYKEILIPSSRNKKKTYSEDDDYYQMAVYLFEKIKEHIAVNGKEHLVKKADIQKWADVFRKIIEIDKRDKQELKAVINWSTSDPFWQLNILSAAKLREKYTQLALKMDARPKAVSSSNRQLSQNEQLMREISEEMENGQNRSEEAFSNHQQLLPEF